MGHSFLFNCQIAFKFPDSFRLNLRINIPIAHKSPFLTMGPVRIYSCDRDCLVKFAAQVQWNWVLHNTSEWNKR